MSPDDLRVRSDPVPTKLVLLSDPVGTPQRTEKTRVTLSLRMMRRTSQSYWQAFLRFHRLTRIEMFTHRPSALPRKLNKPQPQLDAPPSTRAYEPQKPVG